MPLFSSKIASFKISVGDLDLSSRDDLANVVIDLRPNVTREVVLSFDIPDNMPPMQGQVRIDRVTHRDTALWIEERNCIKKNSLIIAFENDRPFPACINRSI